MVRYIREIDTGNEPAGFVINILSRKVSVWSVIRDGMVIIGMSDWDKREWRRFVIIIVQNIKIEISTQNNFVITILEIILSSSDNLSMKSIAFVLRGL